MAKSIKIRKLKNIKSLDFEVPSQGVYLLSGVNGTGKTSLLACLRRIGFNNAFPVHFPVSEQSERLDNFTQASIEYVVNGKSVVYSHAGQRWVPRPRKNSKLLQSFGFPSVIYVGATADRITPRPEDFDPTKLRPVSVYIKNAANYIFDTDRFNDLRYVNLTTGAANQAFVLRKQVNGSNEYFSEKNFSLGELCVIKLLKQLQNCQDDTLVLVDEIELALHPKAQVNLYQHIQEIASDKNLTVIFSTHSVSLIKTARRHQILHLSVNDEGGVDLLKKCYPTYAIGSMALDEESLPDRIVFTEDDAAVAIARTFIQAFILSRYQGMVSYPTVHVVPIGGFLSVVRFLDTSDALLPEMTSVCALLDLDVKNESVHNWRATNNHARLQEFQRQERRTFYLPFTPECGIVEFLRDHSNVACGMLRDEFQDQRIGVPGRFFRDIIAAPGGEQRRQAKTAVEQFVDYLSSRLPETSFKDCHKKVCEVFSKWYFDNNTNQVMALVGRMLN